MVSGWLLYKHDPDNSYPGFEGMEKYTKKNIAEEIVSFVRLKIGEFE